MRYVEARREYSRGSGKHERTRPLLRRGFHRLGQCRDEFWGKRVHWRPIEPYLSNRSMLDGKNHLSPPLLRPDRVHYAHFGREKVTVTRYEVVPTSATPGPRIPPLTPPRTNLELPETPEHSHRAGSAEITVENRWDEKVDARSRMAISYR